MIIFRVTCYVNCYFARPVARRRSASVIGRQKRRSPPGKSVNPQYWQKRCAAASFASTGDLVILNASLVIPVQVVHTSHKALMGEPKEGDLLQGTLDMLILKTLARGRKHGYAIAESIGAASEEALRVEEGALYPALHRLELKGLLGSEWGLSGNNRRAKYYRLTPAGRKTLAAETERWTRMSTAIARVMGTA
jgi:PadR family transcriptional regulator, regulatory protein PadR